MILSKEDIEFICEHTDHTNLKKTATSKDIVTLCQDAVKYGAKSVCVAPHFVQLAHILLENKKPAVCTVVGFPNGYSTTAIKVAEAIEAIQNGADEIDMVLNINMLKEGNYKAIVDEIIKISDVCYRNRYPDKPAILKVIVETCLLTDDEKLKMCDLCIEAGADFIKTSTGFDSAGADIDDIKLMRMHIGDRELQIKASGGIRTLEDAYHMIGAGATRIGASSLFSEIKNTDILEDFLKFIES